MQPAVPKTLLLTGTRPGRDGVGAILLSEQLGLLPPGTVDVVYVAADGVPGASVSVDQGSAHEWTVRFPRPPAPPRGRLHRAARSFLGELALDRLVERASLEVAALAHRRGSQQVWAVLNAPISIRMTPVLAKVTRLPLKSLVWDDIEHQVNYFGLNRLAASACRRAFEDSVKEAANLAVIGESMQARYEARYGRRGVIVRHGFAPPEGVSSAASRVSGPIRIGFAGSVTARSAFESLLAALDRIGWAIGGREVTLVLMGGRFDLRSSVPRRIECLGWRSPEETVSILGTCTLNYLPQPFEPDIRPLAELSFPTKTGTMIATGVPILVHAPAYASLPIFSKRHPFAFVCTDLAPDSLIPVLREACGNASRREQVIRSARQAMAAEFSDEVHRQRFLEFIAGRMPALVLAEAV